MADTQKEFTSTPTVVALSFCLLGLIVLLILLYKKLNKESDGEYTIRHIVFKEGGLRDRVRGAAMVLGTRLGVQLWPHSDLQEHGEEMQEIQDEEGQVDESSSQESDSEEGEQEEEDSVEQSGETKGKGDDTSSLEGSDLEEKASLMNKGETEGKEEGKGGVGDGKGEPSGGGGLQININQLSGSAIWFEEEGGEANVSDVTAL
ncbi:hypothetical protein PAMP_015698 [Pampus punctatissimus]